MKIKIVTLLSLLLIFCDRWVVNAQSSSVTLETLNIKAILDPVAGVRNTLIVDLSFENINSLEAVVIEFLNADGVVERQTFKIRTINGKPHVHFEKYDMPINGNLISLKIKVGDQSVSSYDRVSVRGIDINGRLTNEMFHTRRN
jgi:hypothetical protein